MVYMYKIKHADFYLRSIVKLGCNCVYILTAEIWTVSMLLNNKYKMGTF